MRRILQKQAAIFKQARIVGGRSRRTAGIFREKVPAFFIWFCAQTHACGLPAEYTAPHPSVRAQKHGDF